MPGEMHITGFARKLVADGPDAGTTQDAPALVGLRGYFISNLGRVKPVPYGGGLYWVPPREWVIGDDGLFYEILDDGTTATTPGITLTANDPDFELTQPLQWRCVPDVYTLGGRTVKLSSWWFNAEAPGWTGTIDQLTPVPGINQDGGTRGIRGWSFAGFAPDLVNGDAQPLREGPSGPVPAGSPVPLPAAAVDTLLGAGGVGKNVVKAASQAAGRNALGVDTAIAAYVDPLITSSGLVIIEHGGNAGAPRQNRDGQTFIGRALWIGTVPPNNRAPGDMYFPVTVVAVPVLIWSDSAGTAGALGNTETGGLAWQVGGGYTAAKVGGQIVFTAAGTGVGPIFVTDAVTNCRFVSKIANRGTQFEGTIFLRYQDVSNHLVLCRTSSSVGTYIISKRVAGTQTTVATLTGFSMTNGDVIETTTKSDGTLIIAINGATAYTGNVPEFATATARGVGVRATANATTVAYDDLAVYTLVA